MRKAIVFAIGCVSVARGVDVRANLGSEKVISILEENLDADVHELLRTLDADSFGRSGKGIDFRVPAEALKQLKDLEIEFKDRTEHWVDHFEQNFANPNLFCSDSDEACGSRSLEDFFDNYQSYGAIISRIESLVASSDLLEMSTLGKTYEGREMKLIEVGDSSKSKPLGFIFCNIHAREWLTPMFCTHLIETLVADGGHPLLEIFAFAIVPSANPDGYEYSRSTDNMWRKTRKPNSGSSCVGTDGNRNWDNNHCGVGSSSNPCSQTYCGESPFDQIEVANLNQFSIDNQDRIIVMMDIHAYGSYVIHPFGYTETLPPDEDYIRMRQCARLATEAATGVTGDSWLYGTTPQVLGYQSGGTSKDYFYANLGVIYPYTVEVRGTNFQPKPENIKICNQETFALLQAMFECAKDIDVDGNGPQPTAQPVSAPVRPCNFLFC